MDTVRLEPCNSHISGLPRVLAYDVRPRISVADMFQVLLSCLHRRGPAMLLALDRTVMVVLVVSVTDLYTARARGC